MGKKNPAHGGIGLETLGHLESKSNIVFIEVTIVRQKFGFQLRAFVTLNAPVIMQADSLMLVLQIAN
jgi:hypothetical protein